MRWVVDDFLPQQFFHDLRRLLFSKDFKWAFGAVVYNAEENGPVNTDDDTYRRLLDDQKEDDWFLSRRVYESGRFEPEWDYIRPVMYFIEDRLKFQIHEICRVQVNCLLNQNRHRRHGFHNDMVEDHYVALLYMNTSMDAPTVFEDGDEVEHIENRLLFFRGGDMFNNKHSTSLPVRTQRRIAININLKGAFY